MRRAASILALTVAALASIATERALPGRYVGTEPMLVTIDPASAEAWTATLEATWSPEARRRARFTGGRLSVWVQPSDPAPEGITIRTTDAEGVEEVTPIEQGASVQVDAACTEEACSAFLEVRFEAPPEAEPFSVEMRASGEAQVEEYKDEADILLEVTLDAP